MAAQATRCWSGDADTKDPAFPLLVASRSVVPRASSLQRPQTPAPPLSPSFPTALPHSRRACVLWNTANYCFKDNKKDWETEGHFSVPPSQNSTCVFGGPWPTQEKLEPTRRNKRKRKGLGSGAPKEDETRRSPLNPCDRFKALVVAHAGFSNSDCLIIVAIKQSANDPRGPSPVRRLSPGWFMASEHQVPDGQHDPFPPSLVNVDFGARKFSRGSQGLADTVEVPRIYDPGPWSHR